MSTPDDPRDDPTQFTRQESPVFGVDLGESVTEQRIADIVAALITPTSWRPPQ